MWAMLGRAIFQWVYYRAVTFFWIFTGLSLLRHGQDVWAAVLLATALMFVADEAEANKR